MADGILTDQDVNVIEDWVRRLERARDDMAAAAIRMESAASNMVGAASRMNEAAGTMYAARLGS